MTGRKFTRTDAAKRLGKSLPEVDALIAAEVLRLESIAGDHDVIPEQEIDRYEREHPAGPSVGRWSRGDDPDAFDDRADYDTPNDEGERN
jgi:hypothetical protein